MEWIKTLGCFLFCISFCLANDDALNITMVGPTSPVHLSEEVSISWIVTSKDQLLGNLLECLHSDNTLLMRQIRRDEWTEEETRNYQARGNIMIASVKEEDEGAYNCTLTYGWGGTRVTASYYLTVTDKLKEDGLNKNLLLGIVICVVAVAIVVVICIFYARRRRSTRMNENLHDENPRYIGDQPEQ